MTLNQDKKFLRIANQNAIKSANKVKSNPWVGCIIVKDSKIISTGIHEIFGQAHAEVNALRSNIDFSGATAYVTLEPCYHYGKTPPCVDLLIEKKISRVVIGSVDPNLKTKEKSINKLLDNNIKVDFNLIEEDVKKLNEPFYKVQNTKKPYIILKSAITMDGKLATKSGDSKWISNEIARDEVQLFRKHVNAIMVGKNTIINDNPALTYHSDNSYSPLRVVIDRNGELSKRFNIFNDDNYVIFSYKNNSEIKNIEILKSKNWDDIYNEVYDILVSKYNVNSILVEGGSSLTSYYLNTNSYDEAVFYISPKLTGSKDAISLIDNNSIVNMSESIDMSNSTLSIVGNNFKLNVKKEWTKCLVELYKKWEK